VRVQERKSELKRVSARPDCRFLDGWPFCCTREICGRIYRLRGKGIGLHDLLRMNFVIIVILSELDLLKIDLQRMDLVIIVILSQTGLFLNNTPSLFVGQIFHLW
jgi:hypothetical protein